MSVFFKNHRNFLYISSAVVIGLVICFFLYLIKPESSPVEDFVVSVEKEGIPDVDLDLKAVAEAARLEQLLSRQKVLSPKIEKTASGSSMSDEEHALIEESFAVTEQMTGLLDDGDELNALYEAQKLLFHENREVRHNVLQALDWIGAAATPDIARMMDDPDPEISSEAQDIFWDALDDIDSPELKRDLLAQALKSQDPEIRERALEELVYLPDHLSFDLIAGSINDPNPVVAETARDNARFISGEEFNSPDEAFRWGNANRDELIERDSF
jgi:FOG: HEAT repeat